MFFAFLKPGVMFLHENQVWIKISLTEASGFAFKPALDLGMPDDGIWRTWDSRPRKRLTGDTEVTVVEMDFKPVVDTGMYNT